MGSLLSSHCAQTTHEIQDSPGPDLSIPDQRRQALAYCAANGWDVAIEFVEPGASGTDDRRPELQRLLDMGTAGGAPAKGMDKNDIERFARDPCAGGAHASPAGSAAPCRYRPHSSDRHRHLRRGAAAV
jgi:Resolvase, N terminal domain